MINISFTKINEILIMVLYYNKCLIFKIFYNLIYSIIFFLTSSSPSAPTQPTEPTVEISSAPVITTDSDEIANTTEANNDSDVVTLMIMLVFQMTLKNTANNDKVDCDSNDEY
ncbi:hypothetical protein PIROE2DRAFT_9357 [Piromyces sp. E2]|nr:hypothetical protein PIROE2DRAFT_9357 [Piromyces sp. E2]|eukprot:OUM63974.1 hypothetical protein PIROE2DRAFT_9357 [Piromyces sp. E2]